jgi:putative acetyltransferase
MHIEVDDLSRPAVHALLEEHLEDMYAWSPPESVHALDLARLKVPEITFWTAWDGPVLLGSAALKDLGGGHGEVKSMRTPRHLRRRGAGRALLTHLIEHARQRGFTRLSLETGSQPGFEPARRLYAAFGFSVCEPFSDYALDPNSVFMTKALDGPAPGG